MNNFPRLGFFDVDPERFDAMMKELTNTGAIEMANYEEECYVEDDYYDDSMDGDFDSAMSSAGFGTDEDYGMYDDYNDFYGDEY